MPKKRKSPWTNLLDCVGAAIVAVAVLPITIIDGIFSS